MRRRQGRGFTLIEVLVALAIFALVAVPLINLELGSTSAIARVQSEREAHYLAIYTLDTLLATRFKGERTDTRGPYTVKVRSTSVETAKLPIERLQVAVYANNDEIGLATAYRLRQNSEQP